ncbi:MAG: AmmeMemoRadiSam system radical SAM enzyme [Spirochaetes bacterium GWF1_31_7]|nr:MAG: AmmeMemoRadiSam system radical SAM enzyme [Spirochaetes bacterium GWE1_32_154]OHD47593.1 MAG: AmmeMemoRadiSam system radical SAM enzyme [Spirochaetes bacterium GWE2_31_10]OHD51253.1 MAG: AmmeMemoRadiSam system radical SAM enzyme [Spirochaetes bacterium GWF1_31_7]OHD81617.1 MAG: AmmeMemoRadiSam system radical SAM enzyme [Spirochaetes bacterium RIFOXYB1_FULL_32_8]
MWRNSLKLYEIKNNYSICLLCPNSCQLSQKKTVGLCGIRKFSEVDHSIINPYSGIISAMSVDPIEKKPLYHFMPGSSVFSIGFYGCTLKCQFCQNYTISQTTPPHDSKRYSPEEIVNILIANQYPSIAFTYSEPLVYFEWVLETAKLCKANGIKTILVTNGFINKEPGSLLLNYIDAVNIDLKSFKNSFYTTYLEGSLESVKQFISTSIEKKVHTEITTLIIPGLNDSKEEIIQISEFIQSFSPLIPLHISSYHPSWKMSIRATNPDEIIKLSRLCEEKLAFVYPGNINTMTKTLCFHCKTLLIERSGYQTKLYNINKDGTCKKCGGFNYIKM